ncbi:MAG: PDDEXK nuclease domain-containing protein [Bacilli bacterium]|nr:PDDEXK nuclease domain-containing protein [Bacilli bacterium]
MNYYNDIKNELINNEINRKVKNYSINKSDLNAYYNVGKILSEAGKHYGENVIGDYAQKLKIELNKKYNERTLRRYRQFYNFVTNLKWSAMPTKLSWSHITELMVLSDEDEINYYISLVNDRNISYRKLSELIKDNEYSRIDENTKNKLKHKKRLNIKDFIKSPIVIRNNNNYETISEKVLQKLILEDIESFMKELGNSFCFIGSEYKIRIGNNYNYIDLLLFNYEYNCFVVVELKTTELKKEHIGQIEVYMNYIDENLRKINQDKTIGIIICKQDKKYVIKYCSDDRIIAREYELV